MPWDEAAERKYRRSCKGSETDLTDAEWALVEPVIPPQGRMGRPRTTDMRQVVDAIQYMLGSGCQWRMLPKSYPPFTTVQHYFYKWRDDGTFGRLLETLRAEAREIAGRGPSPTAAIIDSQSVKTTESGGPSGYDAGKKIKGRKRHIATDTEGTPIAVAVHAADVQDRDGAVEVLQEMLAKAPDVQKVFADGAYQGPKLREHLDRLELSGAIEIVKKPKDAQGFTVLYRRWVVERTFAWMGRCRRLAKDFEASLESALAWATLAACRFLVRRIARETGASQA